MRTRTFILALFLLAPVLWAAQVTPVVLSVADVGATAATATQVSSTSIQVRWLIIQADPGNTGNILIGHDSDLSDDYVLIEPGDSWPFYGDTPRDYFDLTDFYVVSSSTAGDDVRISYRLR